MDIRELSTWIFGGMLVLGTGSAVVSNQLVQFARFDYAKASDEEREAFLESEGEEFAATTQFRLSPLDHSGSVEPGLPRVSVEESVVTIPYRLGIETTARDRRMAREMFASQERDFHGRYCRNYLTTRLQRNDIDVEMAFVEDDGYVVGKLMLSDENCLGVVSAPRAPRSGATAVRSRS